MKVVVVNKREDFLEKLKLNNLIYKKYWDNYIFLNKIDYYRLVIFDNGEYGLFTQSQFLIIKNHPEIQSSNWADYKKYADKGYPVMRDNGVTSGTEEDNSWTVIKKESFRRTKKWLDFRKYLLGKREIVPGLYKCDDCYQVYPVVEVHHLDPTNYDCLEEDRFKVLCKKCHFKYTKKGD